MRIMCKTFSPTFCKGHFKDELYDLLKKYRDSNYFNIRRDVSVYMNEITLWELSNEMGMSMYCGVDTKPRFCNYELKIDNRIQPYMFEIREEEDLMLDYIRNDIDSLDAYRYAFEGKRGAGKSNKVLTPLPTRYIVNDGAVILFWSDGDKTIVKRAEDDNFDPVKGFLWAYFQKHSGLSKTKANKYLRNIDKENEPTLTIHIDNANLSSFIKNIFKED